MCDIMQLELVLNPFKWTSKMNEVQDLTVRGP